MANIVTCKETATYFVLNYCQAPDQSGKLNRIVLSISQKSFLDGPA
jgi:hypothetical protein